MQVVAEVRAALVHFSYISTLEHSSLSIEESSHGETTNLIVALQVRATILALREKRKDFRRFPYLETIAEVIWDDITETAYRINGTEVSYPHAPLRALALTSLSQGPACIDIAQKCTELKQAIQQGTVWPEPHIGREVDADMCVALSFLLLRRHQLTMPNRLLRLAHSIICAPAGPSATESHKTTAVKYDQLRKLLDDFLDRDANQVRKSHTLRTRRLTFRDVDSTTYP